mmetsp:Transcript_108801/g.351251  ORF Transcript_108801/g.351251 Transcript_108801/m.351251 type:complete len:225 (+) Transcript_108801:906-1580(+)
MAPPSAGAGAGAGPWAWWPPKRPETMGAKAMAVDAAASMSPKSPPNSTFGCFVFRKCLPSKGLVLLSKPSVMENLRWETSKRCEDVRFGICSKPRSRSFTCIDCSSSTTWGPLEAGYSSMVSHKAVVMAPAASPRFPVASAEVCSSMQPDTSSTSPALWQGLSSSAQPPYCHVKGRSRPVPLWQQSRTAVSFTPEGRGPTMMSKISSSTIMPAESKSQGQIVSS